MMSESNFYFARCASRFGQTVRLTSALVLAALLSACGPSESNSDALDDELRRDLNLASAASSSLPIAFGDTAAGDPAPTDVPAPPPAASTPRPAPAPVPTPAPRPAPAPIPVPAPAPTPEPAPVPVASPTPEPAAAPAPSRRTLLAAGTTLVGPTGTKVCSGTNRPGDRVVMRLAADVVGPDGTRLPAGTPVLLELAAVSDAGLVFRVKGISVDGEILPVAATASVESDMEGSRVASGSDKNKVIGGAIAGAIIGQILGRDTKSTVIGAAGGAAAGTVAARRSGSSEQCLAAGSSVRVVLNEPLVLTGTGV